MYDKIKCAKNHTECVISSKTREKITNAKNSALRIASVGGVLLVLSSFTACSGAKKVEKDLTTTNPTIETKNDNEITKKYEVITTAENETIIKVTEPTTEKTTQASTIKKTTEEYNNSRLDKILESVNVILKEKKFSDIANNFIIDGIKQIYSNYSKWKSAYKDMPTIEEYINETIIPAIKNVKTIEMIDINSDKAQQMLDEGSALAATKNGQDVYLIYNNPKTCLKEEHLNDLELLFHEFKHCKDKKVIGKGAHFENNQYVNDFYLEGGATFHMKFINPLTAQNLCTAGITNSNGNKSIEYGKDNGLGYLLDLYIYENLVYLAGYDTVEQVGQGKPVSTIRDAITKKYGEEASKSIWEGFCNLHQNYEFDYESNNSFKQAIDLQNKILECIKKDIQNLDETNPEQIREFMDVYRNYKIKIMPQIKLDYFDVITSKYFDTDVLDDLLIEKIEKSGAIQQFSSNKNLNKNAIKAILLGNNNAYTRLNLEETLYLPDNISKTEYKYYEYNGKGQIFMIYTNKDGQQETVEVSFNEKEITKIGEAEDLSIIQSIKTNDNDER